MPTLFKGKKKIKDYKAPWTFNNDAGGGRMTSRPYEDDSVTL